MYVKLCSFNLNCSIVKFKDLQEYRNLLCIRTGKKEIPAS